MGSTISPRLRFTGQVATLSTAQVTSLHFPNSRVSRAHASFWEAHKVMGSFPNSAKKTCAKAALVGCALTNSGE